MTFLQRAVIIVLAAWTLVVAITTGVRLSESDPPTESLAPAIDIDCESTPPRLLNGYLFSGPLADDRFQTVEDQVVEICGLRDDTGLPIAFVYRHLLALRKAVHDPDFSPSAFQRNEAAADAILDSLWAEAERDSRRTRLEREGFVSVVWPAGICLLWLLSGPVRKRVPAARRWCTDHWREEALVVGASVLTYAWSADRYEVVTRLTMAAGAALLAAGIVAVQRRVK